MSEVIPVVFTIHQFAAFKITDPQTNTTINEIALLLFQTVKKNEEIST